MRGSSSQDTERTPPLAGPAAPPRRNGELVFEAPWESRLFGLTLALIDRGLLAWPEFQKELVARIAAWEGMAGEDASYRYYERWQEALEALLDGLGLCPSEALAARSRELASRPHGHDH